MDEVGAFGRIYLFIVHSDTSASQGVSGSRLARLKVYPGVVADVICAAGLVDSQQVDGAVSIAQLNADVVAVDGSRPVGYAVCIDLAAKHAHGGRIGIMRGGRDGRGSGAGHQGGKQNGDGDEGAHARGLRSSRNVRIRESCRISVNCVCSQKEMKGGWPAGLD